MDNLCLIITRGDVEIAKSEFKGLIISDGVVTVGSTNTKIESDAGNVRKVLAMGYVRDDGMVNTVAKILREGNEFIYSSLDPKGDTSNLSLGGLISYENWSKE